ncbi:MAG: LysM peptidoglycan-binding domain-containing protein [Paludibacteraceae bacterium]|nr:LysM peptidoglycan-binding domain-containing protein [Paludibacteraceae bacterium]
MDRKLTGKICLCAMALILCINTNVLAGDKAKTITKNGKEFTEYIVADGESLYGVSRKTGVSQEDIIKFNNKAKDGVKKGQKLLIPVHPTVIKNNSEDSVDFIIHNVAPKETMYSISKQYNVTQATIAQYNPTVETGLKAGQTLRIPKFNDKKKAAIAAKKATSTLKHPYSIEHIVMPKETMYGISRQYGVRQEDILDMNPELADGLKIGMTIRIPVKPLTTSSADFKKPSNDNKTAPVTDTAKVTSIKNEQPANAPEKKQANKKSLNISVLLPLMLDEPDGTISKFVEFYEGILMAAKELKNKGYRLTISVYDTKKSEFGVQSVLKNNPAIAKSDYIIGPAYANQVNVVAKYASEKKIPVVIPFTNKVPEASNNPYIYQFNGREGSLFTDAAEKCVSEFKGKNVIVVTFNNNMEDEGSEFAKYLETVATRKNGAPYKQVKFNQSTWSSVKNMLSDSKENVIVLATEEKELVKDPLSQIGSWNNDDRVVSVLGYESWSNELFTAPETYYYTQFKILNDKRFYGYNVQFNQHFGHAKTRSPRFDLIGRDITMSLAGETEGIQSNIKWQGKDNGGKHNGGCYLIKITEGKKKLVK